MMLEISTEVVDNEESTDLLTAKFHAAVLFSKVMATINQII